MMKKKLWSAILFLFFQVCLLVGDKTIRTSCAFPLWFIPVFILFGYSVHSVASKVPRKIKIACRLLSLYFFGATGLSIYLTHYVMSPPIGGCSAHGSCKKVWPIMVVHVLINFYLAVSLLRKSCRIGDPNKAQRQRRCRQRRCQRCPWVRRIMCLIAVGLVAGGIVLGIRYIKQQSPQELVNFVQKMDHSIKEYNSNPLITQFSNTDFECSIVGNSAISLSKSRTVKDTKSNSFLGLKFSTTEYQIEVLRNFPSLKDALNAKMTTPVTLVCTSTCKATGAKTNFTYYPFIPAIQNNVSKISPNGHDKYQYYCNGYHFRLTTHPANNTLNHTRGFFPHDGQGDRRGPEHGNGWQQKKNQWVIDPSMRRPPTSELCDFLSPYTSAPLSQVNVKLSPAFIRGSRPFNGHDSFPRDDHFPDGFGRVADPRLLLQESLTLHSKFDKQWNGMPIRSHILALVSFACSAFVLSRVLARCCGKCPYANRNNPNNANNAENNNNSHSESGNAGRAANSNGYERMPQQENSVNNNGVSSVPISYVPAYEATPPSFYGEAPSANGSINNNVNAPLYYGEQPVPSAPIYL